MRFSPAGLSLNGLEHTLKLNESKLAVFAPGGPSACRSREAPLGELGDFSTDARVLLLSGMALVIGVISAFVAYALLWLIRSITNLAFYQRFSSLSLLPQNNHLGFWVIAVPVAGALVVGIIARFGSEKIRGHGIPEALEAILLGRSRLEAKVALLKPLSAAISIGTGGPFGAEGPIIMTGAAFGSLFAQQFHLSAAERKTLLVAGAAAGMSAIFATPVAAVLLAVELLLFEWKPRSLVPVALAAVVAWAMRGPLLGVGPLFPVPSHAVPSGIQLLWGAGLGVVMGVGAVLVTGLVYVCEDGFRKLPVHWMWWPAIGAIFVGVGGILEPRVLGVGYDTIHALLEGRLAGSAVAALLVAKALVWAIALGSGTSGGVLAPIFIIGGALGAFAGGVVPQGDTALWAALGMTAMMAGAMRSPLTAVIFTVELTHDFNLLPVLLLGSIAAFGVTVLLMRRSILTEKLARRGQHITCEYSIDPLELARVGEVMDTRFPSVPVSMRLTELSNRLAARDPALDGHQGILLLDDSQRLAGIITRGDLVRALADPRFDRLTVGEIARPQLVLTHPDEALQTALKRMLKADVGRLPVVERSEPRRVVGYLGRAAILSARSRLYEEEHLRERR